MNKGRQKNDGRGRMGGRAKGTPNKTTGAVKAAIAGIVDAYLTPGDSPGLERGRHTLAADLEMMQPNERAKLITGLASYIIPKQQAMSIEDQTRVEADALVAWLETAPDDAINAIAEKVLELQQRNSKTNDL